MELYSEKKPMGEYVIVVEGKNREEIEQEKAAKYEDISIEEHIKMYMDSGLEKKEAVKKVAKERNLSKSEVYKYSLNL